jgi:FixJ family two-component response regulator
LVSIPAVTIVDDDRSVRAATCSFIRSLGLRAFEFASAEEFLRSPLLTETACLICDVQMPNMNGIDLQSALVAGGHKLPMIFMTAFPDENIEARAMGAGAIAFLRKPFDGQEMIGCLDIALKAAGHDGLKS